MKPVRPVGYDVKATPGCQMDDWELVATVDYTKKPFNGAIEHDDGDCSILALADTVNGMVDASGCTTRDEIHQKVKDAFEPMILSAWAKTSTIPVQYGWDVVTRYRTTVSLGAGETAEYEFWLEADMDISGEFSVTGIADVVAVGE